jgi:gluconate 2-dehydrogenase gamma chain
MARILPSDDGPGSAEAGSAAAFVRALEGDFLRSFRPGVVAGLDHLQAAAGERFGSDFADCSAARQDRLLGEAERHDDWRLRVFFDQLVRFTLEGFLGDPIHGGNRGFVGWRFIGYDPEAVRSGFCAEGRWPS